MSHLYYLVSPVTGEIEIRMVCACVRSIRRLLKKEPNKTDLYLLVGGKIA